MGTAILAALSLGVRYRVLRQQIQVVGRIPLAEKPFSE
ncbi:hypothetical protein QFZ30_000290 [Arthrobacter pascens]|nr:hypothetical protein [Arthrobacter pascens]